MIFENGSTVSLKFDLNRHIIFSRVEVLVRELVNSRVTGDEFTSHELRGNTVSYLLIVYTRAWPWSMTTAYWSFEVKKIKGSQCTVKKWCLKDQNIKRYDVFCPAQLGQSTTPSSEVWLETFKIKRSPSS